MEMAVAAQELTALEPPCLIQAFQRREAWMAKQVYWLSDADWRRIEPLLPRGRRGAHRVEDRRVISGIVHMLRCGARWRDCPEVYGPYTANHQISGICREALALTLAWLTGGFCKHLTQSGVHFGYVVWFEDYPPWWPEISARYFDAVHARGKKDSYHRSMLLDPAQQFEPIHARHLNVREHEVDWLVSF
jgi:hypothetical protein